MNTPLTRRQALALIGASAGPLAMSTLNAQPVSPSALTSPDDPYLWLEEVDSERALTWVRERNAASRRVIEALPGFAERRDRLLSILDSRDRIPGVSRQGDWLYNFWRDQTHPRGLWRRTTLAEYRRATPDWQVLLDLDALAKAEGENWVWAGAEVLPGSTRALLQFSRGGADATVVREFDTRTLRFVTDGFSLPEAKSQVTWLDADRVLVGTDFGPGSMTDSGYARVIKLWRRGQPLGQAVTVHEGRSTDVSAFASVDHTPGHERVLMGRSPDFFTNELALWTEGAPLRPVDKPASAELSFWRDQVLLRLRADWTVGGTTWPRGALLIAPADAYLRGDRRFTALFTPTATRSLDAWTATGSQLLLSVLDNVANRLEAWHRAGPQAPWQRRELATPFPGHLQVAALHDPHVPQDPLAEHFLLNYTDFLTPDSLYLGRAGGADAPALEPLKSRPSFFDATGMRVEQQFATSKDGTRVPYFIVWPRGAQADGRNPTLLYGYGGFEVSLQPWYLAGAGTNWLNRGGVFVVANIRGGGEFGPAWHQAALKANRQRAFDDFIAVAEDLIARGVTQPRHLGIQGGSNGGLLVGAVMVQRPELFNAVVCQVPLLDMKRFHTLLAGASWMGEYGNPDVPEEWAWISRYSPYQNVRKGLRYPEVFFVTSTRDDRVHPAHARKMAARMIEQGHPVLYYENIEGGHGAGADNFQHADRMALEYSYFWRQLGR